MPDSTQQPTTVLPPDLRGVALHTAEEPTGMRTTYARVPAEHLHRVRDAVDEARAHGLTLAAGWQDVLIVWGRPGKRPLPEVLTATPGDVAEIRELLLELDR
jgi:hypothetical protein